MAKDIIIYARVGYEYRAPNEAKYLLGNNTTTVASVNNIGGQNITSSNNKNRDNEPYVELDMTYLFTQATQIKVGYKLKLENTEQPGFFDRKVQGVYAGLTHKLTRKTQLLFFGSEEK